MDNSEPIFIDANALVYFLDETAEPHQEVVGQLQRLVDNGDELYTSHHVIEEVLFVVSRLSSDKDSLTTAVRQIVRIPNLQLVEPDADLAFAARYVKLYQSSKVGINDTLLLQLMLDAGIARLFSYDEKFLRQAKRYNISGIPKNYAKQIH